MEKIGFEIINPNAKLINISKLIEEYDNDDNTPNLSDCYYVMEHIGRICYNSYDKPKTDAEVLKFLTGGASRGHRSIFEFGALRMITELDKNNLTIVYNMLQGNKYITFKYSQPNINADGIMVEIQGSPRAFIELLEEMIASDQPISMVFYNELYTALSERVFEVLNSWETFDAIEAYYDQIREILVDTMTHYSIKDITSIYASPNDNTKFLFLVQCSRSESHEIVRHRPCSYMQASQRYIRYGEKNPYMVCLGTKQGNKMLGYIKETLVGIFDKYVELLKDNKPEDARVILPNCTETKIFIYADKKEYRHFSRMRQSVFAYPPVKEVFDSIYFALINKKFI